MLLALEKWEFYVVPTSVISSEFGPQKTVALSSIEPLVPAVGYEQLRDSVEEALARG